MCVTLKYPDKCNQPVIPLILLLLDGYVLALLVIGRFGTLSDRCEAKLNSLKVININESVENIHVLYIPD